MGHSASARDDHSGLPPVLTVNGDGESPFVLVCDHASNRIPARYASLGLGPIELLRHIAWDPGALAVSLELVELLDAPLIHSTISRLVIDCNRHEDRHDLILTRSELTDVPGNVEVSPEERRRRIEAYHRPFHAAIEAVLDARAAAGRPSILVGMHSFTPVFHGVSRPWPIGLIPEREERFTRALQVALADDGPELLIGWNEPYSSLNGVTYTLEHHGGGRGLDATMIEIRNDEIREPNGVALWAGRLARCLDRARKMLNGAPADEAAPRGGADTAPGTLSP